MYHALFTLCVVFPCVIWISSLERGFDLRDPRHTKKAFLAGALYVYVLIAGLVIPEQLGADVHRDRLTFFSWIPTFAFCGFLFSEPKHSRGVVLFSEREVQWACVGLLMVIALVASAMLWVQWS